MKKKVVFVFILILIFALILLLGYKFVTRKGNIRNAKITIEESNIYSNEEIQDAVDTVLKEFKNYPAKLIKLWYDEDRSTNESEEWKIQYNADEALVLYSDFKTYRGSQAINHGFNSNDEYKNWKWVLVRVSNGPWQLKTMGY